MGRNSRRARLCAGVALSALVVVLESGISAKAQSAPPVTDAQLKALQAQIDQLQKTVKQLEAAQTQNTANADAAKRQAGEAEAQAAQAKAAATQAKVRAAKVESAGFSGFGEPNKDGHRFLENKPGTLTFYTHNGEITAYGNIDVSADGTSKNVGPLHLNGATPPVGNFGWMPAISTNLSYIGVRGFEKLPTESPLSFVYQLETGFEVSATPGLQVNNSSEKDTVNGALFSRNSYIGLASAGWGAIKVGKTDAPYKNSTAAFNPFSGELGDYAVIMGNSGGDNRVEFGTRLDHAIWYELPTVGGFQWNVLYAPGQNRSWLSADTASGESDCAGGDDPESGGNVPVACNDGSFSDAASANISYTNGGFYATAAYEWHHAVNRQSDITAIYGIGAGGPGTTSGCATGNPALTPAQITACQTFYNQDVADEDAAKVGALYKFASGTTIGAIGERLHRYVPADLDFQNERTRYGTWVFASQQLTPVDSVHVGWAHAFHTPGDPGQHNDSTLITADGGGTYAPTSNQADMVTAAYKHLLSPSLTWYTDVAATMNGANAHYDLGAGGRANTTDCHDAFSTASGFSSTPHCYTGTTIVGVSTGLQYRF